MLKPDLRFLHINIHAPTSRSQHTKSEHNHQECSSHYFSLDTQNFCEPCGSSIILIGIEKSRIENVSQNDPRRYPPVTSLSQCTFRYNLLNPIKISTITNNTLNDIFTLDDFQCCHIRYMSKPKKTTVPVT